MLDKAKNFIKIAVPTGYDSSATAVTLAATDIVKLPQPPFNLVWWNSTDFSAPEDDSEVEVIRVTATGSTASPVCTITRAQEGTSAKNHNVYAKTYKLINAFTAGVYEGLTSSLASISASTVSADTFNISSSAGHTGTHTVPGSGSTTHTVQVQGGIITKWTEA